MRIGFASSQTPKKKRWTEVAIDKLADGYRVTESGCSAVVGEHPLLRETVCRTGAGIMAALTSGTSGKVSRTALLALRSASAADAAFAQLVEPVLPEDLTPVAYAPRSARQKGRAEAVYVVHYPQEEVRRPIRFQGRLLGAATSQEPGSTAWTDIELYRTVDGRYVAVKTQFSTLLDEGAERRPVEPYVRQREVAITTNMAEVVRAFAPPGRGWVRGVLLDALDAARDEDPTLDDEIGPDVATDTWAHELVGSTELRPGDARFAVLDYLDAGAATIVTIDVAGEPNPIGFIPSRQIDRDEPKMSPRLIRVMSLQALIYRVRDWDSRAFTTSIVKAIERNGATLDDVSVWCISPKGAEVLQRARGASTSGTERR